MKKHCVMTIAIVAGLILPCIVVKVSPALAQTGPEIGPFVVSAVVTKGDPTSDGGTFFPSEVGDVKIAGEHALNDLGQVVISGFVGNCTSGVYVVSSRTGFRVTDVCRPSPFGRFALFAGANINNHGQVVLNMGPIVDNVIVDMVLLYSDGQLSKVVADGDRSPRGPIFEPCGFSRPIVSNTGTVAFSGCSRDGELIRNGVFTFANGNLRQILQGGDPSPLAGVLSLNFAFPLSVSTNDNGDVLFVAGQIDPDITVPETFGLFLATANGIKKVELGKDTMPNGSKAADDSFGLGSLNNKGDVAFFVKLAGKPKAGIFTHSHDQISTVALEDQPTPIGGTLGLLQEVEAVDDPSPRINDNSAVAFMSLVNGGSSPEAIFLASPRAMIKVVGVGDRLPTGEKIRGISTFSLNNLGQIAFFAHGAANLTHPLGVYLATPNPPQIRSIKLKQKKNALQLRVNGTAMITNDTVIEINGVPLNAIDYPPDFREDGGTITQVVSRDARLEQMMSSGQTVQVTVYNSLTNLRSGAVSLTR